MKNGINLNVILVGSSPLPCYIQAEYALQGGPGVDKPDKILFVATDEMGSGTERYVTNIESVLEGKGIAYQSDRLFLDDGYNSYEIENKVFERLEKINQEDQIEKILLNNTGGTKAMAVYATSAVRKFVDKKAKDAQGITITECFVDPKQNKLRCYDLSEQVANLYPEDVKGTLKDYVKLDIKNLIYLHYGRKVKIEYSDIDGNGGSKLNQKFVPLDETQMQVAQRLLSDSEAYSNYEEFYKVCTRCKDKKKNKHADKVVAKLKEEENLGLLKDLFSWTEGEYNFLPFLDGDWLELYFYKALLDAKKILAEKNIFIQTVWSCKVKPEEAYGKEFEVDILAVRGYELTLFSVSMAANEDGGLAKGKWFEAVYRTEQMSGEHGKVAVVNFLYDKKNKKTIDEFKSDLATFKREVEIYNKPDMKDYEALVKKIVTKFE